VGTFLVLINNTEDLELKDDLLVGGELLLVSKKKDNYDSSTSSDSFYVRYRKKGHGVSARNVVDWLQSCGLIG
jgi:hypothetical protein